ncbi:MAG: hypothetical protein KIT54_00080 [Phycisphaeraceae bacterium]|nr:hypothetical protein [Phycisphaeraceae bacterium]
MAEQVETSDKSVTLRFTRDELAGLSNVINHALHGGFVIEESDCHSLIGLDWVELQELWGTLRESGGLRKGIN